MSSIVRTIFPGWTAAVNHVREHGTDAAGHARDAWQAPDGAARLDGAVRSMISFDHAIDASRELPVKWLVGDVGQYYAGYELAKQAVELLVSSGIIPGARERVGVASLEAAREEFLGGVEAGRADRSRYGRAYATGLTANAFEDAQRGVLMLRDGSVARPLLGTIRSVHEDIARKREIQQSDVRTVVDLIDRATGELQQQVTAAEQAAAGTRASSTGRDYLAESRAMLQQVEAAAMGLVASVPDEASLERDHVAR